VSDALGRLRVEERLLVVMKDCEKLALLLGGEN
jgi:hypothetical protein